MTKRKELEVALAKAEAALGNAVTNSAKVGVDQDEANDTLDRARAHCRQTHAALIKLKRSEPIV